MTEPARSVLRVAVVGYGYWGPNLVRNFAETRGASVAGVADLDPEKLAIVNRRFPAVRTTTDFRSLLYPRTNQFPFFRSNSGFIILRHRLSLHRSDKNSVGMIFNFIRCIEPNSIGRNFI